MKLLVFMIFLMPFEANPYLMISDTFLGIFQDFTVIKLLGLCGLAYAAMKMATGEVQGLFRARQAQLFLLFFVGVLIAGAFSGSGFLAISKYLAFLSFMPFVYAAVESHTDLRRLMYALGLTFVVMLPYGVRQMYRYDSRLGTGVSETNYLAAHLVLVIPLVFAIASTQIEVKRRRWWMAAGLVLVMALFLTASRGGFLGLIVAGVVFAYRRKGVAGATALLAALLIAGLVLPTGLAERALATLSDAGRSQPAGLEASNHAHIALFWAALRMIANAPLTGVGPYNFKTYSLEYSGLEQAYIAHNSYLELAAELGLPLLAVFLLLVFRTFRVLSRAARLDGSGEARELAAWAEGLRSGLTGFLVVGAFISAQYEKMFWVVVFASIVIERMTRSYAVETAAAPTQVVRFGQPALPASS